MEPNHTASAHGTNADGFVVGDVIIETRLRRIRRPDGDVELTQRVFDLLQLFASEPFIVHSRRALFERVWGTHFIEDTNLTQNISVLRKALGEERKHWIKTVSRTGYSFEPPAGIRYVEDIRGLDPPSARRTLRASVAPTASADAVDTTMDAPHAAEAPAPPAMASRARAAPRPMLVSSLMSALIAFVALATAGSQARTNVMAAQHAGTVGGLNMSVVITRQNADGTATERLVSNMLTEWVRWKLARLPSIDLVEEEDLIAGRATPSYFLDLAVTASRTRPGRFDFDVAFRPVYRTDARAAGERDQREVRRRLSLQGDDKRLSTMIDAVSNQTLALILPHMKRDAWPRLDLDDDTAARFADAAVASRYRRADALPLLQRVVQDAPKFGPARMLLARELAEHRQFRQASEQAALGRALSMPLPGHAAGLLEAETAELTPAQSDKALRLYALLWSANPARMDFLLSRARILLRTSQPEAAFQLLSRPEWERQTGPLRVRQLVARADSAFMLGYLEQCEQSANAAIERIGYHPEALAPDLGTAQLIHARMSIQRYDSDHPSVPFSKAAATFDAAGYGHDADVARFYEAIYAHDVALAEKRLAALLKATRENGDHINEIWAQRMMAIMYAWAGERGKSVLTYNRALESANLAGDIPSSHLLELDLLAEDLRAGDLQQAMRRVERLHGNRLWTKYRYRAAHFESDLLIQLGRYREALAVLDRVLGDANRTTREDMPRHEAGDIACARMSALTHVGELNAARAQSPGCRGVDPVTAALNDAGIDLLAGDAGAARRHMQAAEADIDGDPDDWEDVMLGTRLAMLKIRLRDYADAERRLEALHRSPAHRQYGSLLAEIELGLAEVAAARGDWRKVAAYGTQARRRLPAEARHLTARLDVLEASRSRAVGRSDDARAVAAALAGHAGERHGKSIAMDIDARR